MFGCWESSSVFIWIPGKRFMRYLPHRCFADVRSSCYSFSRFFFFILGMLYGEEYDDTAATNFRAVVYRLRKMLPQMGLPEGEYILSQKGTYQWNEDAITLDIVFSSLNKRVDKSLETIKEIREILYDEIEAGKAYYCSFPSFIDAYRLAGRLMQRNGQSSFLILFSPIDFESLWEINPDVVGWIQIDGTQIDYPILYDEKDNEKYLHTDIEGNDSVSGAIYLDADDTPDFTSLHNVIYGHHMKNGNMFKDVVKYKEQDFFDAHRDITIYLPEEEIQLKAFACTYTEPDGIRRKTQFKTQEDFRLM